MSEFATYDPNEISITFAGAPIAGFGEGTAVRLSNITPGFSSKAGVGGMVVRSKSHDRRGKIEFMLMSSSSSNTILSAIHNLDLETPNGSGVGVLFIRDRQGATIYEANKCWIVKAPDAEINADESVRTWELECSVLKRVDAGR